MTEVWRFWRWVAGWGGDVRDGDVRVIIAISLSVGILDGILQADADSAIAAALSKVSSYRAASCFLFSSSLRFSLLTLRFFLCGCALHSISCVASLF